MILQPQQCCLDFNRKDIGKLHFIMAPGNLKKWSYLMVMEFNQNKYELFFRRTNTVYNYIMGENCLSISFE